MSRDPVAARILAALLRRGSASTAPRPCLGVLDHDRARRLAHAGDGGADEAHRGRPGLLDLLFIVRGGRAFWIELKAEGESMSAAQEKMTGWLRGLGVRVYLAHNYNDVLAALEAERVPLLT